MSHNSRSDSASFRGLRHHGLEVKHKCSGLPDGFVEQLNRRFDALNSGGFAVELKRALQHQSRFEGRTDDRAVQIVANTLHKICEAVLDR